MTYYETLWFTQYDWAYKTVPQANLGNREVLWPRGKVLGGSTGTNGMYLIRPSEPNINAWQSLISSMSGADRWNWNNFYAAMKAMETFGAPSEDIAKTANIKFNTANHGTSGPIHHAYPGL